MTTTLMSTNPLQDWIIFSEIYLSFYRQPKKKRFYTLTVFNILISILDIVSLALILFIIHFYTAQNTPQSFSFLPAWLMNKQSVALALVFFVFFLVKNIAAYLVFRLQYSFVYNVAARISQTNMLSYLEGSYAEQVHTDSSKYIRGISNLPIEFGHYVLSGVQQIITEATLITMATAALLVYNARLFAMVVALLLPVTILTWLYTRKRIHAIRGGIKSSGEISLQYLKEALAGFAESNIYGKNLFFTQRYSKSQQTLNNYLARLQTIQGTPARMMEVFAVFGLYVLIAVNKATAGGAVIDIVEIGAFMAAAYKIIPGIVKVIGLSGQIKAYRFTAKDLLATHPAVIAERSKLQAPPIHTICFHDVSFSYNSQDVLAGFNMQIKKGEMVGISSDSGKGKTTIINLLLGFLKEDAGRICINEEAAGNEDRKKYWGAMAYVKQQNFLIHDTIERNITLDNHAVDKERLREVTRICGLESFAHQFPEGMDKVITENGKNISGGQRQRIAIARALYKDASLIILDEPFNELDNASETALVQHFRYLSQQGKMVMLITHRQESLSFCHKIFSINE